MPTTLQIKNGPPFRKILFLSMVATDHGWQLEFDFAEHGKKKLTIFSLGRFPVGENFDEDIVSLVGAYQDTKENWEWFFYVGQYNCRTRKGFCERYSKLEFIASPVGLSLCEKRNF